MTDLISRGDPQWQSLYDNWVASKKPGVVVLGERQFRVFPVTDEDIKFQEFYGIDPRYGSLST